MGLHQGEEFMNFKKRSSLTISAFKKIIIFLAIFSVNTQSGLCQDTSEIADAIINKIIVQGNQYVTSEAILNRLPYATGNQFDPDRTSLAIKHLYDLGSFRQVRLDAEILDENKMNLYVVVEEKKLLECLEFTGNSALRTKQIKEKLNLSKLTTVDEETMRGIVLGVKKLYRDENRHNVHITYKITPNATNPQKASATVIINEGAKSLIKYVNFVGNTKIPSRKLQNILFTRENWLLGFLDSAGSYNEEMLDMDKHRIEYFYRDQGYLMAKTAKTNIVFSDNKHDIAVTFNIKEGNQFRVRDLKVIGDEVYDNDELFPLILLEEGEPYSQAKLVQSMNRIKDLYGEKGYIYCDVFPQMKPDEQTSNVDITFHIERGNKLYANRIVITGNHVTRDKVIRRQLDIVEGDLITTRKLKASEQGVEYLSFFERAGVTWKMHRLTDELADLEMNVQETKTGNFNFQASYGTDQTNPKPSLRGTLMIDKGNLFGKGWDVGGLAQFKIHRFRIQKLEAHFLDPHIFDSNISAGFYFYKRWDEYDQWNMLDKTPHQKITGGHMRFGFWLPNIDKHLQLMCELGIEDIKNNHPRPKDPRNADFARVVQRTFQEGTLSWFGLEMVKDIRDHQVYPKHGYKLALSAKTAPPGINHQFSFFKAEVEASYYTPIIEKFILGDSLVLALHLKMGGVESFSDNRPIPYKELFHVGGQSTVRGFVWGGIGPAWENGDPLGARKAIVWNTELIFPLIPDYSMKAHLFYDAGAGFHTPTQGITDMNKVQRNSFDLRHSVGFGLNLVKPVPAKIDWGFKLNRKKGRNESPHEFHLSMNHAW